MITYRNYINGQWQESLSSKTVENSNPARISDVLGTVNNYSFQENVISRKCAQAAHASSSGRLHSASISRGACSNLISACSTFFVSASKVGK